jgi:hypothetical protein
MLGLTSTSFRALVIDPRHYQIAGLGFLLAYGQWKLHFGLEAAYVAVLLGTVLLTQAACTQWFNAGRFDPRSPLISGLSLCLLLRTNGLAIAALAAFVTIASKYVSRWRGKHIFNPTNGGIVFALVFFEGAWVSPGQWGTAAYFAFLIACLGGLVVGRARRADVPLVFLACYAGLLFARAAYLGDPWAIPLRQLQSGALLIFAFFMISDPKTTPDSRVGRLLFVAMVALTAAYIRFGLYRPNDLLYALAALSPLVPMIDRLFPAKRYEWPSIFPKTQPNTKGIRHEHEEMAGRPGGVPVPDAAR